MAIRFHETDARPMGRTARGVRGIALGKGQEVVGMVVVGAGRRRARCWRSPRTATASARPLDDYRLQRRGGKGLITIKCSERNGPLIGIRDVRSRARS